MHWPFLDVGNISLWNDLKEQNENGLVQQYTQPVCVIIYSCTLPGCCASSMQWLQNQSVLNLMFHTQHPGRVHKLYAWRMYLNHAWLTAGAEWKRFGPICSTHITQLLSYSQLLIHACMVASVVNVTAWVYSSHVSHVPTCKLYIWITEVLRRECTALDN